MNIQRELQIENAIGQAKEDATSWADVQEYEQQEARIVKDFLSGSINITEYEKQLESLCNEPQRVIFHTVEELLYALTFLDLEDEILQDIMTHELDHFTQAKAKGLQARFCLTFYVAENGRLAIIPGTQVHASLLNELSDEQRRNGLKAAIAAPKVLSPEDEQLLL